MNTLNLPLLYPAQREIALDTHRYRAANLARQTGKSTLDAVESVRGGWEGRSVMVASPTYGQNEIVFSLAKRLVASIPVVTVRESARSITFPSGGVVLFRSCDQPDNLRGHQLDLFIGDEWSFAHEDTWPAVVRPMLAVRHGRALFTGTPRRVQDHWHQMIQRGDPSRADRDHEWRSWSLPATISPYITANELDAARRSMPSIDFQREFLAEFVSGAGTLVARASMQFGHPPQCPRRVLGVDLATSERTTADWTALVVVGRGPDGIAWVLDARRVRASFNAIVNAIRGLATEWTPDVIAVEDVGFQRGVVTELQRTTALNVRGVRPQGDKSSRFSPVAGRIETGVVKFSNSIPDWLSDEVSSFPIGSHDDGIDALSLAFAALASTNHADRLRRAMTAAFDPTRTEPSQFAIAMARRGLW